jgi:HK97 family phage portal protein
MKNLIPSVKNFLGIKPRSGGVTVAQWLRGDDLDHPQTRFVAPYQQSAWIYVAVSALAETAAHVPFRVSRRRDGGEEQVESGPLLDLFNQPGPDLSRTLFWQTLVSWEALRGEFFIVPVDASGRPVRLGRGAQPKRLITLNPDHMQHIVRGNELIGWRYSAPENTSSMPQQLLLPEEVIHSRTFNPYLYWRGMSPLSVALVAAEADFAAEQFMKALMQNNGDPGVIVTSNSVLSEDQRSQILAKLRDRKRSNGVADRPLLLDGNLTVQKPMISSADLEFLENRRLNREEIGSIFKVPESMMGFGDEKSGLSAGTAMQQDRLNFIENTIGALCRRLESAIEPIVKSFDPELRGWFDVESLPIMQAARRERLTIAEKAFGMGVPFNEINELFSLGFKPLPWGDKGYINKNVVEVGDQAGVGRVAPRAPQNILGARNPELAVGRMLELVEKTSNVEHRTSNVERKDDGKLRRFIFEQRNRALERLEQEFGFLHVQHQQGRPLEPVLDLKHETALFFGRLGNIDGEHVEANEQRVAAVNEAVQKGFKADEDFTEIAARIKQVY